MRISHSVQSVKPAVSIRSGQGVGGPVNSPWTTAQTNQFSDSYKELYMQQALREIGAGLTEILPGFLSGMGYNGRYR